jgi:hypothetical protein
MMPTYFCFFSGSLVIPCDQKNYNRHSTECFIDLGKLNLLKISLPWSKSVKLTVIKKILNNFEICSILASRLKRFTVITNKFCRSLRVHYNRVWLYCLLSKILENTEDLLKFDVFFLANNCQTLNQIVFWVLTCALIMIFRFFN